MPQRRMVPSSRAYPSQAESWCGRLARRPNVSLIWPATQIAKPARTLDRKCEDGRCPDRTANTRSSYRSRPGKQDGVLAHLKAKSLRGGPKGPALTRSARAILLSPRAGRRGDRSRTKRSPLILDTPIPHVSNPPLHALRHGLLRFARNDGTQRVLNPIDSTYESVSPPIRLTPPALLALY